MDYLATCMHPGICAPCTVYHGLLLGNTGNSCLYYSLDCLPMTFGLTLKTVIPGTIILNTTRNILHFNVDRHVRADRFTPLLCDPWEALDLNPCFLHEGDLGHIRRVTFTFTQLGNACIAARTAFVTRRQFIEHLLDDQFVRQCAEDTAAGVQFNDH